MRTVKVRYTNPGKPEGKRSPPKTTTRPIHKVAVVVPAEYMFEDDTCDNVVGSRCPRRDLGLKEEMEVAAYNHSRGFSSSNPHHSQSRAEHGPLKLRYSQLYLILFLHKIVGS